MSHRNTATSSPPEATHSPFGENTTLSTAFPCATGALVEEASRMSYNLTSPSNEPDASKLPFGENATHVTSRSWPVLRSRNAEPPVYGQSTTLSVSAAREIAARFEPRRQTQRGYTKVEVKTSIHFTSCSVPDFHMPHIRRRNQQPTVW